MMHRISVIDIGTNSILYLLAELQKDDTIQSCCQSMESVRPGRNLVNSGTIHTNATNDIIRVLNKYKAQSRANHAEDIMVVGTRVFRTASNTYQVCKRIFEMTGLRIEVLTADEEARWSFAGATYGKPPSGEYAVVDIGGGSTEIAHGSPGETIRTISMNMGAVHLTEKYIRHDPPQKKEIMHIEDIVKETLHHQSISLNPEKNKLLVVGGTITTLAAIHNQLSAYDADLIDGYTLTIEIINDLFQQLIQKPVHQRRKDIPFDPERADILIAGTIILKIFMTLWNFQRVIVSDRGLRFGIALREFSK